MSFRFIDGLVDILTSRSKLTVAVMLALTVVMLVGAASPAEPADSELGADSLEQEKLDYINANYGVETEEVTAVQVYVRSDDGNVLSRESMLATLSLSTFPALQQLGFLVAIALLCSLVMAVFVLPVCSRCGSGLVAGNRVRPPQKTLGLRREPSPPPMAATTSQGRLRQIRTHEFGKLCRRRRC